MSLYPGGKESQATPNLFQLYDRDREEDKKPLSPEAASTFRTAVLGKLGWVAQSRPDLCWLCSMLARGQAQPLAIHETAMRASIRYIRSVSDRKLKFRSYGQASQALRPMSMPVGQPKSQRIGRVLQEQLSSFVIVA